MTVQARYLAAFALLGAALVAMALAQSTIAAKPTSSQLLIKSPSATSFS